ncbi:sugar kinase [Qaidamihabitans albus]|uniref:sugar kinase n=1 Tax=Qaidamihabitans albus TaxID=2795733 RepID=UPI0018F14832|nr:sugar kinase [Qaidamihabitans albus]
MPEPLSQLDAVTFGEIMAMFVAGQSGPLEHVTDYRRALAGAEYNVAVGLARLGHRVGWVGRVGDDPFGRFALAELARHGIDGSHITVDPVLPTAFQMKGRAHGDDPEVVYFRSHSAGRGLVVTPAVERYLTGARHLHATGIPPALSPAAREFADRAVSVARAAGLTVSVDPNLRPALWDGRDEMVRAVNDLALRADWVLPGVAEGEILTGRSEPEEIAAWYLERGVRMVAVKNGAHGAELFTVDGDRFACPAFAVDAVDTVGAGDGFAAGLISAALDGDPPERRLVRAAGTGALATTRRGDQEGLPDRAELAALTGLPLRTRTEKGTVVSG